MAHTCEAAVVHCIDFRFQKAISQFMEELGYKTYDRISVAGAIKSIAAPETDAEKAFLLKQIDISVKLHDVKTIVLMNHEDCGAYGGKKAFDSDATEHDTHMTHMNAVRDILKETYPTVAVRTIYAHIDPEGVVSFEEPAVN